MDRTENRGTIDMVTVINEIETTEQTAEQVAQATAIKRDRATNKFIFDKESLINGEDELFTNIQSLIMHFIKSYDGKELSSYAREITRKDGIVYNTLRMPKTFVALGYSKLQSIMEIEETQATKTKTTYVVKRVYPKAMMELVA